MKAFLAFLLVLGVFSKYETSKEVMAQLNRDALGNSIMSLVQMNLATGAPIDNVAILLNNIGATLNQQQDGADAVRESDEANCDKLIADYEKTIHYHSIQITALTKLIADSKDGLAQAEKDLRQTVADIEHNEKTYAQEQALREQQHTTWVQKDAEHEEQIEAIDEASKIVQHLQAGIAFTQLKSRFDKVQAKLAEGKNALFKPLITALTQLASKVSNKEIIRILELLAQIRQQLVQSRNALRDAEERQAANWAVQSAHLTNERKRLIERKAYLENAIANYKTTITKSQESLEDHGLGLEDSQEGLALQQKWCAIQAAQYEETTHERERQLEVIERLIEVITTKLSTLGEFIQVREDVF